jgi:molybdopterin biosynthesis enzyme
MFLDVPDSIDELVREKLNMTQDLADAVVSSDSVSVSASDIAKYLK